MIVVRAFEPDDLPAVWALGHLPDAGITEDPDLPVPLPARRVAPSGPPDLVDPGGVVAVGGYFFVALDGEHVVGVGGLRPVRERPRLGRVIRIRVHPARRRRGVGRQLSEALEATARRAGMTDLLLEVGDHQPEALAFYRTLGWSETWREAGPEWQWETVWHHRSLDRDQLAVEVRPCAGPADAEAAERGLPTRGGATHHSRWESQAAGEATYLLAWDGDDVVGHVLVWNRSRHPQVTSALGEHPELHALGVAEWARHRGVATALMGAAAGFAQEQGARSAGLALDPANDVAASLYRRLGWLPRPGLAPVEEWSWVDEQGVEHLEQDRCGYWTIALAGARQGGS